MLYIIIITMCQVIYHYLHVYNVPPILESSPNNLKQLPFQKAPSIEELPLKIPFADRSIHRAHINMDGTRSRTPGGPFLNAQAFEPSQFLLIHNIVQIRRSW